MKFGILKETKNPPDRRVAVTPNQAKEILNKFPNVEVFAQKSELRCFNDKEYSSLNIPLSDNISDCDILIGVKEVAVDALLENKTYIFFSHTAKKQPYNQKLLQEIIKKKITLLDHEYFTDKNKLRLVAFGKWAGIVGAYNALIGFGLRNNLYKLKRAKDCFDFKEMIKHVEEVKLPNIKILITGGGRVAKGAMETLAPLKLKYVKPDEFISKTFNEPVICQIDADTYTRHKNGNAFDIKHFFANPTEYESTFRPFAENADIYIAAHYWDPKSPEFITENDFKSGKIKIQFIADISCDIKHPIASTLRPSTIAEPFFGYNPVTGEEGSAFEKNNITVMTIDNLPGELPRDASVEFGNTLVERVYPSLFGNDTEGIIERATIVKNGKLTSAFSYLKAFAEGKE
ncbi:MAG: hypothetical protein A2046_00625 [Bacteroidetes bacterium GWA2_30_7]|nr:MAG: hypothetical protein A2046_00625 [Bacteroidetes bacterium GWA2_30_7]